jgi:hypothetical protein
MHKPVWLLLACYLRATMAFRMIILNPLQHRRHIECSSRKDNESIYSAIQNKSSHQLLPEPAHAKLVGAKKLPVTAQEFVSNISVLADEWLLAHPDLNPETPATPLGQGFLSTNIAYLASGTVLRADGDMLLGSMSLVSGFVSFWYHYEQLQSSAKSPDSDSSVRIALLTDYASALTTSILCLIYVSDLEFSSIPIEAFFSCGLAFVFFFAGWFPSFGFLTTIRPKWAGDGASYIFLHSIWHVLSAATFYYIGEAHVKSAAVLPVEELIAPTSLIFEL